MAGGVSAALLRSMWMGQGETIGVVTFEPGLEGGDGSSEVPSPAPVLTKFLLFLARRGKGSH